MGPIGVPHLLTEDDTYNGYFIPSDTVVIANLWFVPSVLLSSSAKSESG